jgi:hypothetical protein
MYEVLMRLVTKRMRGVCRFPPLRGLPEEVQLTAATQLPHPHLVYYQYNTYLGECQAPIFGVKQWVWCALYSDPRRFSPAGGRLRI